MNGIPTRNELLYLLETNQIESLINVVKNIPPEIRNEFDSDIKNRIGRAIKDYYNTVEVSEAHHIHETVNETPKPVSNTEQVEFIDLRADEDKPLYDEEKYLAELTNLCKSVGIKINSATTSKNGSILPFISFDLTRGFDSYFDKMLISLCEENNIDMRFSRKYQNEFNFIIKLNKRDANMGYIFAKIVESINSTNVETDYSKLIPGDLDNLKNIYLDENDLSDIHQVIYTKLEDNKYAYLLNSDLDIYIDLATSAGFTECASGTNTYRTAQLISFDKDNSVEKLDHLASNIRYTNSMYTNMMSNHANEVVKEYDDVPYEQIANIYNTYRVMDGGNSIISIVVGTPLDKKNERVVKVFRPTVSPTETRMLFRYHDSANFDNEILPKLVSTFANNGRTKTTIGVITDSPRVFYQAMSDYGDTLSLANMSVRSVNSTKQLLNETNRVYHHVQRDLISEYEKMNAINGFMATVLFPFLLAFTSFVAIAMIIQIIMNS